MSFNVGDVTETKRMLGIVDEPDQETFNRLAQSPSFEIRALLYDKVEDIPLPFARLDRNFAGFVRKTLFLEVHSLLSVAAQHFR